FGKTVRTASSPRGTATIASAMKTYRASAIPAEHITSGSLPGQIGGSACSKTVTSAPNAIINNAMQTGAQTGPHHGRGIRKRMSQLESDFGQPVRGYRQR